MAVEIVPTILTRDPIDLEGKIRKLEGLVERVQIDIIDGIFLPEKTVGLEALVNIETNLKIDIHLMVKDPEEWIERCLQAMADRVIGQVEMMENQEEFIEKVIGAGLEVGLAMDLSTPVSAISEETLTKLDLVLVLTRKAGFGNFPFEEKALEKVKFLRRAGGEYLKICVDGGISEKNIQDCLKEGANILAVGGAIWRAKDIRLEIEKLKRLAGEYD